MERERLSSAAVLSARGVAVRPPGASGPPVVRDVTLEVARGEWLAITGPNGGGKSSLALALGGLWATCEGAVTLAGRPFAPGAPADLRARVAVVMQEPSAQLTQPTVRDELAFAARNLGTAEAEIARRIERIGGPLGLDERLDDDPHRLSAGRQQALLIAAALVAAPELLIVDEGTAHLDARRRARVLAALRGWVREGLAIVAVTQEPAEIAAADRVLEIGVAPEARASGAARRPSGAPAAAQRRPRAGPALEIRVAARERTTGPCVATARPFAIRPRAGGIAAVTGSNGAGKSVLLAAAAGVTPHPQIEVRWGHPPAAPPVFAGQFPELQIFAERVGEEVTWAALQRGLPRAEALARAERGAEALALGGRSFLERRTWDLSAGEKRLALTLAALVAPASLVLLDEPTCGLDSLRRERLGWEVSRRAASDPVLVASQDSLWLKQFDATETRIEAGDGERASLSEKTD